MKKINLACGHPLPEFKDWINIDNKRALQSEYEGWKFICHDITKPLRMFKRNTVNVIFCEHMMEHFDMAEAIKIAKDMHRVLVPQGMFRVVVPDAVLRKNEPPENGTEHNHKTAWTYHSLDWMLKNAGFKVELVKYWNENGDLIERTQRMSPIFGKIRRPNSLIADGVKT